MKTKDFYKYLAKYDGRYQKEKYAAIALNAMGVPVSPFMLKGWMAGTSCPSRPCRVLLGQHGFTFEGGKHPAKVRR